MMFDVVGVIYIAIYFVFGIIFLWEISLTMIREEKLSEFFPMFLLSILIIFQGVFVFYDWFLYIAWGGLEILFAVSYLWIFINLRRKNGNRK